MGFNVGVKTRLERAQAGEASNVGALRLSKRDAANPNQFGDVSKANQYGTPLTNSRGLGLVGYRVGGTGELLQDGSVAGATPAYGVKSFTNAPDTWTNQDIKSYLGGQDYQSDLNYVDKYTNRRKLGSKVVQGAAGLVAAGFGAAFLPGLLGGGAVAPAGGVGGGAAGAGAGATGAGTVGAEALLAAPTGLGSGAGFSTSLGSGGWGALGRGALSGALQGGAKSYLSGDNILKGAAMGGLSGGAGGYLSAGGNVPGLGSLSSASGSGSGALGSLSSLTKGGSGMGLGSLGNLSKLGNAYSAYQAYNKQDDIEDALRQSQEQAMAELRPYNELSLGAQQDLAGRLEQGYSMEDFQSDPAYQFQLEQGNKMLDRRLSASGQLDSGKALKAAQEYGQGLATQSYDDAYRRYLQENQQLAGLGGQGLQAAGGIGNLYGNMGNISAGADVSRSNILTGALSDLFRKDDDTDYASLLSSLWR